MSVTYCEKCEAKMRTLVCGGCHDSLRQRIAELEKRQAWIDDVPRKQHPDDERPWCAEYIRARHALEKAERERDEAREAIREMWHHWCEHLSFDGEDLQFALERSSLLVEVPADEAFRDEFDADTMLVLKWSDAALEGE